MSADEKLALRREFPTFIAAVRNIDTSADVPERVRHSDNF
jgi:hypothetical protein